MECIINNCSYEIRNKKTGYCNRHYLKYKRHGDPYYKYEKITGIPCSIDSCTSPVTARGWCIKHYDRWITKGSPYKVLVRHELHGLAYHELYNTWQNMKSRCYNKNGDNYANYGGKGVTICDRWLESFANFLDDMGERPNNTTLDRINPFGDYEPGNCRWANKSVQVHNTRGRRDNKSGYPGVIFDKRRKMWRAYIGIDNERVELGRFGSKSEAISARSVAEVKYYGTTSISDNLKNVGTKWVQK